MGGFLIYGTTGYTGRLIAEQAVERGLRPIIGGRDPAALAAQAAGWGVAYRAFDLRQPEAIAEALRGVSVVLNCAGPFARTAAPLAAACLRAKAHYLDLAGETPEFEALLPLDAAARQAGALLMPGVGFGVVPTDAIAVYLKQRLPDATKLTLAFATKGGVSRGTLQTLLKDLHRGGLTRANGALVPAPAAWRSRRIDFGQGPQTAVTNPWRGDLSAAFVSTGIPTIETYSAFPAPLRALLRVSRHLGWLLGAQAVQNRLQRLAQAQPAGPTAAQRAAGSSVVWGEVENARGERLSARLHGPDAYELTALTALAIASRALAGDAPAGFQTPAGAYGPDFVLDLPGVRRVEAAPRRALAAQPAEAA